MPIPSNDERCHFTYADGRRCRMPKLPNHPELCFDHWQRTEQAEEARQSAGEIVNQHIHLDTAKGINRALANLFRLAAQQQISPRYAASMAYIGQLLLCSLPHVQRESAEDHAHFRQYFQQYFDPEHFKTLTAEEKESWKEFFNGEQGFKIKEQVLLQIQADQRRHRDDWINSFKPRKRGRPRKHAASGENGSADASAKLSAALDALS